MNDDDELSPRENLLKPRKVYAGYRSSGSLLKTKLRASQYEALQAVQKALEAVSGRSFSATVILRRALENYVREVLRLSKTDLGAEAMILVHRFR